MSKKEEPKQINPDEFSYRRDGVVEMPAETFEILRSFMREEVKKRPAKKLFLGQKPVYDAKTKKISFAPFDNDEEYRNQVPLDTMDVDSVNFSFMEDLLFNTHLQNIEKGNAVDIVTLKKEVAEAQENRLKKVEE